jgi:hypothetical protein
MDYYIRLYLSKCLNQCMAIPDICSEVMRKEIFHGSIREQGTGERVKGISRY